MPLVLVGLALSFAAMLLFGGMAFDRSILVLAGAARGDEVVTVARLATELGGWRVLVPATAAGTLLLIARRDWRGALLLPTVTLSGRLAVALTKDWTGRLRPEDQEHLVAVQSLAFPSGHAANATLVWLCLALLIPRGSRARLAAIWAATWIALAAGASRVVLAVHWPSDVIAGWAFGLFWTLLLLGLAGRGLAEGTPPPLPHSSKRRRVDMDENRRAETAREHDDSDIIDSADEAPEQGGRSGGRLARDIGTQDAIEHGIDGQSVTRVRGEDKKEEANRPRFNQR